MRPAIALAALVLSAASCDNPGVSDGPTCVVGCRCGNTCIDCGLTCHIGGNQGVDGSERYPGCDKFLSTFCRKWRECSPNKGISYWQEGETCEAGGMCPCGVDGTCSKLHAEELRADQCPDQLDADGLRLTPDAAYTGCHPWADYVDCLSRVQSATCNADDAGDLRNILVACYSAFQAPP